MSEPRQQSKFSGKLDEIKGKPYMRAHSAVTWFREDFPIEEAAITTTLVSVDPILWRAEIWFGDRIVATGHAAATANNRDHGKLETNAVRRALAYCGYGTEAALEDDDFDAETGESLSAGKSQFQRQQPQRQQSKTPAVTGDLNDAFPREETTWTKTEAEQFVTHWRNQALTDANLLAALGVSKLGDWKKGRVAADKAVRDWQNQQLEPKSA